MTAKKKADLEKEPLVLEGDEGKDEEKTKEGPKDPLPNPMAPNAQQKILLEARGWRYDPDTMQFSKKTIDPQGNPRSKVGFYTENGWIIL